MTDSYLESSSEREISHCDGDIFYVTRINKLNYSCIETFKMCSKHWTENDMNVSLAIDYNISFIFKKYSKSIIICTYSFERSFDDEK